MYLIGGASAQGNENDTVVVYTPAVLGVQYGEAGVIYMLNMTLPHGTFYSDITIPSGWGTPKPPVYWCQMGLLFYGKYFLHEAHPPIEESECVWIVVRLIWCKMPLFWRLPLPVCVVSLGGCGVICLCGEGLGLGVCVCVCVCVCVTAHACAFMCATVCVPA